MKDNLVGQWKVMAYSDLIGKGKCSYNNTAPNYVPQDWN